MYYTKSHVFVDTAGLSFHMNCKNVHVHAKNLFLYGNEGHYGGNLHFWLFFFTNISITMENSYIGAGQATRGAGVLVTINEDLAVNDKDSCGQHTVLLQMQHKFMHFSNVTFQGNNAKHFGAGFQMEDRITPGHWCVNQLVLIQRCKFMENMVTNSWNGGGSAIHFSSNPFSIVLYDACKK